jgi:NAD(P)-dependent dehydrogenase (short-subunit alcohol dehydrogenase family)
VEEFSGKTAVVTGAAGGIGRAIATAFAREGMRVVVADLDGARLADVAKAIAHETGAEVHPVAADVSRAPDVDRLADEALTHFGAVHVVCNNAGVLGRLHTTWETSLAEWEWILGVNLRGVVHGVRAFVPLLVEQGEGHVVNVASAAAWLSVPGLGPYAASKHAVLALSEALRLELEDTGSSVGVSVVCPQFVRTDIAKALLDRSCADNSASDRVGQALGRRISTGVAPEHVADIVLDGIRENRFVISEDRQAVVSNARRRLDIAGGAAPRFGR